MKQYKFSCTNELLTKIYLGDDDFGNANQLMIYAMNQAVSKYPKHSVTSVGYMITHDKLKNITHEWCINMMPTSEFINQE